MVTEIPLTRGKFALIDDDDLELVLGDLRSWKAVRAPRVDGKDVFYALRNRRAAGEHIQMHRLILDAPKGIDVDHINGDGLDNRRLNLRLANDSQNAANRGVRSIGTSSRFKGVTWNKACEKWQAAIEVNGRSVYLGLFEDEAAAAANYNVAAMTFFGEFASINAIEGALP